MLDFQQISAHMCKLRLKGKFFKTLLINIQAMTENKAKEIKDTFLVTNMKNVQDMILI